jgi:outer membrane protein TolC
LTIAVRSSLLLAPALLVVVALGARAETLDDAWNDALMADPALRAAQARERAANADLDAARADRRPSVAATTSVTRWRTVPAFDFAALGVPTALPLFAGRTSKMAGAQLTVPLYTGGALGAAVTAAGAAHTARAQAAGALAQDVKLAVAAAYVGVLRAQSALGVAAANRASLETHAREVEDMQRTGQVPRNDALAAAVALADARQRELAAGNELDVARAVYNKRLGRDLAAAVQLEESIAVDPGVAGRPLEELLSTAHMRRSELEGLDAVAAGLEARAAVARAERLPQISLQGGYTRLDNEVLNRDDFWSVGVSVSWKLFDAGRSRAATVSLAEQSAAAADERADLATAIELDVRRAWLALGAAHARVDVTEGAVAQADENVRVVSDRYRNGEGTNGEVLDAEALRELARNNYDSARYDAALAELRLARAIGAL